MYSSVLIWLDSFPLRFGIHFRVVTVRLPETPLLFLPLQATEAVSGPYGRSVPGAPCAYSLSQQLLASQLQRHPARVLVRDAIIASS